MTLHWQKKDWEVSEINLGMLNIKKNQNIKVIIMNLRNATLIDIPLSSLYLYVEGLSEEL
ncbi:hypothetical protein ACWF7H_19330 [Peribacillus butanolivorans]